MLLSVSVGLPFLVVSATAPMLQAWFSRTGGPAGRDPYFLYAASNLGSLLALLSYPLLIESQWTLSEQAMGWAAGYGLLMLLIAGCAVQLWRSPPAGRAAGRNAVVVQAAEPIAERPDLRRRLHWLALSLVPSSLLLGVTTYISTDIAAIPLLWVLPLALYLLTFVAGFRPAIDASSSLDGSGTAVLDRGGGRHDGLARVCRRRNCCWLGVLHLLAFFVTAMVCHGQLAGDRPGESHLTEFYLWMSLGGVLGGLLNALVAPLLFSGAVEYPLMMAAACLLRPSAAPLRAAGAWLRQFLLPAAVLLVCGGDLVSRRGLTDRMGKRGRRGSETGRDRVGHGCGFLPPSPPDAVWSGSCGLVGRELMLSG